MTVHRKVRILGGSSVAAREIHSHRTLVKRESLVRSLLFFRTFFSRSFFEVTNGVVEMTQRKKITCRPRDLMVAD